MGSVEFDVDWRVSPQQMRAQLQRIVADEPLWDGRSAVAADHGRAPAGWCACASW